MIQFISIILLCFLFFVPHVSYAAEHAPKSVRDVSIQKTLDTPNLRSREGIIVQALSAPSLFSFTRERLNILIDHTLTEPRGRMRGRDITLSALVARDTEFTKLFVHEFAHFVDIYILVGSRSQIDPSHDFYRISWQSPSIKRAGQMSRNFVSGYAATNQYEDFAETFVFYVFHNRQFEERAMRDETMRQKYLFFRNTVFPSGVFVDTDFSLGRIPSYTWDTTRLPISLQKYLYSLN